jgi:uncharacterized CHY-type Zn-finger protein
MESIPFLVAWAALGLVGFLIGQSKGRDAEGAVLGMFLGPLGWLLVAVGPDRRPKCPHCHGAVQFRAVRCCHCGEDLPPQLPLLKAPAPPPRLRQVQCPACQADLHVTPEEYTHGLRCAACSTGFVPAPSHR